MTSGWSTRAHRWHKAAVGARASYEAKIEAQARKMALGPHLADDGYTLVVPSEWYSAEAAAFWKAHGFTWKRDASTWERDTRRPHDGKRYTPAVWLESTRKEFYRFWPQLLAFCALCGEQFTPYERYQIYCPACGMQQQARRKFHDENQ